MAEELDHDGLLWDDQSWEFPNLDHTKEDCGIKSADISNSDGQLPAKEDKAPPPPPVKGKKKRAAAAAGESEDHELHIWTERERRKKMRNMFSNLHALLPHIPPKADKSTIVDEAVSYIKNLQKTLKELETRKKEGFHVLITHDSSLITQSKLAIKSREAFLAEQGSSSSFPVTLASPKPLFSGPEAQPVFKTWTSPNVILNICGRDGHINVCSMKKPGLFTALCFVMEKHNLEVVSAQACSDRARCMFMIHARANGGSDQFHQAFPAEEIFKQAAAEIMLWVNS